MAIYALATPYGKSGVAIIRISGEHAMRALYRFGITKQILPRLATRTLLYSPDSQEIIDDILVLFFPGPASFSGEDTIEIHCHGSRAVISEIIKVLQGTEGFRLAEPGEFSKRAFFNGKMDLTKAEGLADLIDAETSSQHRQAVRQMSGALESLYEGWRSQLLYALAFIEALIDFPEEDLPASVEADLNGRVGALQEQIARHLGDNGRGEKLRSGLNIAIIGAPNVGKSSLMNWLMRRDVAIVSNIPGTTRDVIEAHLDIAGYPVTILDTAGIRDSDDAIEVEGIKRAKKNAENADIIIQMTDAQHSEPIEGNWPATKVISVLNKIDISGTIHPLDKIAISVKTGEGTELLMEALVGKVESIIGNTDDPLITRARYREHLQECLSFIERFNIKGPSELMAENLRMAARQIGMITGRIELEQVLDVIFGSFCIGK